MLSISKKSDFIAVRKELIEVLYRNLTIGLIGIILQATILLWQLFGIINTTYLLIWYFAICAHLILGLLLIIWYQKTKNNYRLQKVHHYLYILGSSITALYLGVIGSLLMPSDIMHQALVMIVIVSIVGAGIQSLHASYFAASSYLIFSMGPLLFWLTMQTLSGPSIYAGILIVTISYVFYLAIDVYSGYLTLVNNIKLKIENIRYVEQLKHQKEKVQALSVHDPLTGLYNRRQLEMVLYKLFEPKSRIKIFSFVMIDIDYFKNLNDKFGHVAGDVILERFSECLCDYFVNVDNIFRYGGEEFIIILENLSSKEAFTLLKGFRKYIKSKRFEIYPHFFYKINFSAGIAEYPSDGETSETIIEAADRALYRSKQNGRDLISVANKNSLESISDD